MNEQDNKENDFAGTLKNCRLRAGLTQKEVAERAGLSTSYIALLESGKRPVPGRDVITRLANACETKEVFLLHAAKYPPGTLSPRFHPVTGVKKPSDLESAVADMFIMLVRIVEWHAPELSYGQIFHRLAGLPLEWKFFIVRLYEDFSGSMILTPEQSILIQDKVAELEELQDSMSFERYSPYRNTESPVQRNRVDTGNITNVSSQRMADAEGE